MNEDTLNLEIRKYLKKVGLTSQREIEHAIFKSVDAGDLSGKETLAVEMVLSVPAIGLHHRIEGEITLE
jgi:Family of unknown function (DUF6494)